MESKLDSLLWSIRVSYVIPCDMAIHLRSRLPRHRHGNIINTIEIGYSCSLNRTISEKLDHWYPYSWIALALITRSVWLEKKEVTRIHTRHTCTHVYTYRIYGNTSPIPSWRFAKFVFDERGNKSFESDGGIGYMIYKYIIFFDLIISFKFLLLERLRLSKCSFQ